MGFLDRAKDAAVQKAILGIARPKLAPYGELRQFNINTAECTFSAEVLLNGETSPITVPEGRYRVEQEGGQTYVVLHSIKVSREWAQKALDDHMPEIRLKAPDFVRSFI